jgi:hypothetical protein
MTLGVVLGKYKYKKFTSTTTITWLINVERHIKTKSNSNGFRPVRVPKQPVVVDRPFLNVLDAADCLIRILALDLTTFVHAVV